jgi:ABC-2 type transport system permease protein
VNSQIDAFSGDGARGFRGGWPRNLLAGISKFRAVMQVTLRSRLRYLGDFWSAAIFILVVMYVFVELWRVTYAQGGDASGLVAGFSLTQMIWYLVATETIILSMIPIHRHIENEIKSGDVAIRLNKPYSFLGWHAAVFLGEGALKALVLAGAGGAIAFAAVGFPSFAATQVPALVVSFVLTALLNFCWGAMIGLLAFWTEDVTGFFFVLDRLKWLMGGFLMPIPLFPVWMQGAVAWSPFPLMIYEPARLAIDFSWARWLDVSGRQFGLLLLLGLMAWGMYRAGVRRLDVNGG